MQKQVFPIEHWLNKSNQDIDEETWVDLPSYEGLYMVSDMGRVKTYGNRYNGYKKGVLCLRKDKDGYVIVNLYKIGIMKTCKVHRLVCLSFHPNPENKEEVNHKKGIRWDNRKSELEWATIFENMAHRRDVLGTKSNNLPVMSGRMNHKSKPIKCDTLSIEFESIRQASKSLGLNPDHIVEVLNGKRGQLKGLSFTYNK